MSQASLDYAVFAALLLEMALAATWNRMYFIWGFPIYRRRVPLPYALGVVRLAQALEGQTARRWWGNLMFNAISDADCAFRESFTSAFQIGRVPYAPVMRGLIHFDRSSGEVTVTGLCNWYVVFGLAFVVLPAIAIDVIFLPLFVILFGGSYVAQRIRFNHVLAAIQGSSLPSNSALERTREG